MNKSTPIARLVPPAGLGEVSPTRDSNVARNPASSPSIPEAESPHVLYDNSAQTIARLWWQEKPEAKILDV